MKKLLKTIGIIPIIFFMIIGLTTASMAQNSVSTNATADIVTALVITKNTDLVFGAMTVPSTPATVIVNTLGNRSLGGGTITLLSQNPQPSSAQPSSASFSLVGELNAAYTMSYPSSCLLSWVSGPGSAGPDMIVDNFTIYETNFGMTTGTGQLNGTGDDTFSIGGTLNLASGQNTGHYTGAFLVTVNYN